MSDIDVGVKNRRKFELGSQFSMGTYSNNIGGPLTNRRSKLKGFSPGQNAMHATKPKSVESYSSNGSQISKSVSLSEASR